MLANWITLSRYPLLVAIVMPPATALGRTADVAYTMSQRLDQHEAVNSALTFAGFDILTQASTPSGGVSFVILNDWEERKRPDLEAQNLAFSFMGMGADIKEGLVLAFNPPPIIGMSMTGGGQGRVMSEAADGENGQGEGVAGHGRAHEALLKRGSEKFLFTASCEGVSFGSPAAPVGPVTLRRQVALVMPLSGEELSVSGITKDGEPSG